CRESRAFGPASCSSGSATIASTRLRSSSAASRYAARRCDSSPATMAGSGTPQCAVTGDPNQTGQVSPAALSQTVITKSMVGAPSLANSSHDLLRKPSAGQPRLVANAAAIGCTSPAGWLPALNASKRPWPSTFSNASAMMLRAELPVHRNSTRYGCGYVIRGRHAACDFGPQQED